MAIIRKQRRVGKIGLSGTGTATKLPIFTNTAPVWLLTPDVHATQGTPSQIVIVSSNVIDSDVGQTITITYIGSDLTGTGWRFVAGPVGTARYEYDGIGAISSFSGLRLRATDNGNPNLSSDSPLHQLSVTLTQQYGWLPNISSISIPVGGTANLDSYYSKTPGEITNYSIVAGETELNNAGMSLSGSVISHDGRSNSGTSVTNVQFESNTQLGGSIYFKEIAAYPMVVEETGGALTAYQLGKHSAWSATAAPDGFFYGCGGDKDAPWFTTNGFDRYKPSTKTFEKWHNMFGTGNKRFPFCTDQVHWARRAADNKLYILGGYYSGQSCNAYGTITTPTIPNGSSYPAVVQMAPVGGVGTLPTDGSGGYVAAGVGITDATYSSLPSGIELITSASSQGQYSYTPAVGGLNVLGNQSGHGDDRAFVRIVLKNNSGANVYVPSTTFTFTTTNLSPNVTASESPPQLPATIPAGKALYCTVRFPSYNQNPTGWRVPAVSWVGKALAVTALPSGVTMSASIAAIALDSGNAFTEWFTPAEVTAMASGRAAVAVVFTNNSGNAVTLTNHRIDVAAVEARFSPANSGFPDRYGVWRGTPGASDPWEHLVTQYALDPVPAGPFGQTRQDCAEDQINDCVWVVDSTVIWKRLFTAPYTITSYPLSRSVGAFAQSLGQVFKASTQEVFAIEGYGAAGNTVISNQTTKLVAISVAAGTIGNVRTVATFPKPWGAQLTQDGLTPMTYVPSRDLIIVATCDWLDFQNWTGASATKVVDGGLFVVNATTGAIQLLPYPTDNAIIDIDEAYPPGGRHNIDDSGTRQVNVLRYDSTADVVWGSNKNARKILHWGWA